MSPQAIEDALRRLPELGRKLRDEHGVEVWELDLAGRRRELHFFTRRGAATSAAATEAFYVMRDLQRANLPAPRVVAHLIGFRLQDRVGDALLIDAETPIEPIGSGDRQAIVKQFAEVMSRLAAANVRVERPGVEMIGTRGGELVLRADRPGIFRRGKMTTADALAMATGFGDVASRADRVRVWRAMTKIDSTIPKPPRPSRRVVPVGAFAKHGWRGAFVSRGGATSDAWADAWKKLHDRLRSGQLDTLKDEPSGRVSAGELIVSGVPMRIVVKEPKRKAAWKRIADAIGFSRAKRLWTKALTLDAFDLPIERPILFATRGGERAVVFAFVKGTLLVDLPMDALNDRDRRTLMHRLGATLRKLETLGLSHYDAKSHNWIVTTDADGSPRPVLIDLDGIRRITRRGRGMWRLMRALREVGAFTESDRVQVARGYEPFGTIDRIAKLSGVSRDEVLATERRSR